ncbi:MAG: non-heme iron oxygenase ferredoxin subunit [Candidatus Nanopelagicales bacterium]|jgi:3-phenylpropionate/trans-cinnamate dioxygenase ferredoxin subunit
MSEARQIGVVSDVPPGTARQFKIGDELIVVINTAEGLFAIEDRCSHADVALSEGEVDGCLIECWLHGSAFDVRTGVPTSLPAITPVKTFSISADSTDPNSPIYLTKGTTQ